MTTTKKVRAGLLGLAVGDALGVPVEFKPRKFLDENPVTHMQEYGTYEQPRGTWSDDSSLAFCLADSLIRGYDLKDMAQRFIAWKEDALWTPHGEVFDIGTTTSASLDHLQDLIEDGQELTFMLEEANPAKNGNGGLMRILPLYFYLHGQPVEQQFATIQHVTMLTHPHIRATLANVIYLLMADFIVKGYNLHDAYAATRKKARDMFRRQDIPKDEQMHFYRVIDQDVADLPREDVFSDPYVIYSLEASLWCLLNSNSYEETALKAVNLGSDTDTNAAIAGGLAGLYYGEKAIPKDWRNALVKYREIEQLADKLAEAFPLS